MSVPPDRAWSLFAEVADWSRWDWLGSADSGWVGDAGWVAGNVVRNGHRPFTFDCTVVRVDAPKELAWRGRGMGTSGVHVFRFLPHPDGCRVESDEVFDGFLVPVMRPLVRWYWRRHLRSFRRWCALHG